MDLKFFPAQQADNATESDVFATAEDAFLEIFRLRRRFVEASPVSQPRQIICNLLADYGIFPKIKNPQAIHHQMAARAGIEPATK